MFCKLASFDLLLQGHADISVECVAEITSELLLLAWPQPWLANIFKAYPQKTRTEFAMPFRIFGRQLRRSTIQWTEAREVFTRLIRLLCAVQKLLAS